MRRGLGSFLGLAVGLAAMMLGGCGGTDSYSTIPAGADVYHYYLADQGNHRVVRFDALDTTPKIKIFTPTTNATTFAPADFVFVSYSRFYVLDKVNSQILRIDVSDDSNFTTSVTATFGAVGSGTNQFLNPNGIALDSIGRIYVADTGNHRIVRFDNFNGDNWTTFGSQGTGTNEFESPYQIRLDKNGRIVVTDQGASRLVRFNDMSGSGWATLGSLGNGTLQFSSPTGLDVDFENRYYVSDSGNKRVVRFDDITGLNWTVYSSGTTTALDNPVGLAVLGRKQILVTDLTSNRVVRYIDETATSTSEFFGDGFNNPVSIRAK